MRTRNVALAILALLFLLTIFKPHEAARILDEEEEEEELMKRDSLLLQSLDHSPVDPSRPDPGTYIPASSTLGQKGFAGRALPPPPPAYPQHTVRFGVATN
ncbi:hypothetical protein RHMOL_Rhmol01G0354900 [Rhododendron molle]|uniref:Uncharacterized protein n=1 Tax=Rhododendron molle TaxID=49168 RepID=A0ACC0QC89_RHOML|nr:hypothetical protein RHMOL_Rhmol01G0354900 [Rhododendron molle]